VPIAVVSLFSSKRPQSTVPDPAKKQHATSETIPFADTANAPSARRDIVDAVVSTSIGVLDRRNIAPTLATKPISHHFRMRRECVYVAVFRSFQEHTVANFARHRANRRVSISFVGNAAKASKVGTYQPLSVIAVVTSVGMHR